MFFLKNAFFLVLSIMLICSVDLSAKKKKVHYVPKEEKLDKMFTSEVDMFELGPDEFEKQWTCFRWADKEKKTRGNYLSLNNYKKLTIFDISAWEAIADFKDGKFSQIKVSLYNRGDAESSGKSSKQGLAIKVLDSKSFQKLINDIDGKINNYLKVKGKELPPVSPVSGSDHKIYKKYWVKGTQSVGLEWNIKETGKTSVPEYLNFIYLKFDPMKDPRRQTTHMRKTGKLNNSGNLKDNVKKKEDGFTYIDNIPMIDQGPKGYCAAAATARILQYYGSEQDMHSVGQVIKVTAAGTNPVEMLKQLKKATPELGTKVYTYLEPPSTSADAKVFYKEVKEFNKMLEKEKMGQIPASYPMIAATKGDQLKFFKEFKTKKKRSYYKKFLANIKKNIDQGIPVAWSLFLGYVKEDGKTPQSRGGHMRLIIGYNKDMSKLVFTDTWGAGHEYKTIDSGDAWISTSFYGILKPKK